MRVYTALRSAAGCSIIITAMLSLWPFRLPSLGPGLTIAAHVIGYACTGFLTRMVLQQTQSRVQIVAFVGAAALIEMCQLWLPARSASLSHWLAASAGGTIGVLTAKFLLEPGTFPL